MASHWNPQDDFILRNSIESGVSLESLAKGAVKFSRKFTISELTNRWHSLLYNPQVRSLSSSIGFELQYSAQFLAQSQDHDHHNTKRVRSQYYTARKSMRLEPPINNNATSDAAVADPDPEEEGNAFRDTAIGDFSGLDFDDLDIDNFHLHLDDTMEYTDEQDLDQDDDRFMNQFLNHNGEQIEDFYASDTTTRTEHVLFQEPFQDPLFQQPNTSFNQTTSQPHHQVVTPRQEETWIAPQSFGNVRSKQEEICHQSRRLYELDPHPEIKNGVIICILNRESDEIPENDDFNPQLYNPKARNSVIPSSSSLTRPPLPPIRGPSSSSQANGNDMIQRYGFGDSAVSTQANSSTVFRDSFTEQATPSFNAITSTTPLQHSPENGISGQTLSSAEMVTNAPLPDQEENNIEIESDEDFPSYSDVEAMILDMDLEPVGDRYELEARRNRNEEMLRKIMRLEQSAESYMNRDIASHGAFALLYGSSKYYINKPEVLLGRDTGEYQIDIDLGKLESGTGVSRKQALIRLKQDGSFEIKNLGKYSIWMNDTEIKKGEVVDLKNNCLIQIRKMTFVFEMNKTCVKRYLDGIRR
ncbi:hypothetical protein AALP_AA2G197700 [Arabis alpina]|uniref:FHA domain-containing protein n=1 Tax=Arabis alpina TaxID=50452 RepID=A0A087HIN6_ARAAL|nr:hypothetical protein AALP_AA2G197700 [Arabis alpina]